MSLSSSRSPSISGDELAKPGDWKVADRTGKHSPRKSPKPPSSVISTAQPRSSSGKHRAGEEQPDSSNRTLQPSQAGKSKRSSRWDVPPSNPSDRTARDVRTIRESAPYPRSRTVTNHGQEFMVPGYSSPSLANPTKAYSPVKPTPGTQKVMPSYAAMTQKSSGGDSNMGAPLTPRDKYHLKIFRKDRGQITRDDQWAIQAEACDLMEQAQETGNMEPVIHSGTRMTNRELQIYCTPTSGITYKKLAIKMGYDASLPGDKKPGHPIYGSIPRAFRSKVDEIGKHIAAGTFGAIKATQITVLRKPWWTASSNIFLHLEVDEDAFEWLRRNLWMSSIGLYIIRWSHPPVRNITGYIAPDANIGDVVRGLEGRADKQDLLREEKEASSSEKTQGIRSRHVTGAEIEKGVEETRVTEGMTAEEERQLLNEELSEELQQHRQRVSKSESGTSEEDITITEGNVNSSTPNTNHRKRGQRHSDDKSIAAGVLGKTARKDRKDGGTMSSPSDTGEDM